MSKQSNTIKLLLDLCFLKVESLLEDRPLGDLDKDIGEARGQKEAGLQPERITAIREKYSL